LTVSRARRISRARLDVGRLALKAGERLVDHHACVGQGVALALRTGREQEARHRRRLTDAHGRDIAAR
jgi:hypothetical protein